MLRKTLALLLLHCAFASAQEDAVLQVLESRRLAAEAALRARQAYFSAEGISIEQAFPHLTGEPLADPAFLEGRRQRLNELVEARARERLAADEASREAVGAACDAEDATDLLELRLIASVIAGLELAPRFAQAELEGTSDPRASMYQRAALRRMTRPDDGVLDSLVLEDLAGTLDSAASDRLRRALPLLDAELAARVQSALSPGELVPEGNAQPESPEEPTAESVRHREKLQSLVRFEEQLADVARSIEEADALTILDASRPLAMRESLDALEMLTDALGDEVSTQIVALGDATGDRRANLNDELSILLSQLEKALSLRRQHGLAPPLMPSDAYLAELRGEVDRAALWLRHEWQDELRSVRTLPENLMTADRLTDFLWVSFDLLLLVLIWLYVRRASVGWLRRALDAARKRELSRYGWHRGPRYISDRELEPIGRYGTDALGALVLHYLLVPRSELLALLALLWVAWALVRSIPPAVRLILIVPGRALDPLSRFTALPPEVEDLGVKTAKWFLWWWIVSELLAFVAVPLLQADRLRQLVSIASWTALALLVVYALSRWFPWIREFIAELADQNWATEWLSRETRSRVKRVVRAGLGVLFVAVRLVFWFLVDRGWLSRAEASLVVSQLKLVDAGTELLPETEREKIRAAEAPPIERKEDVEQLAAAFEAWLKERRRGLVAVIGDHGMGKTVFLEQVRDRISQGRDIAIETLPLPPRKQTSSLREELAWLTEPLGIEIAKGSTRAAVQKTIIDHLESEPPRVFLLDDAHLLLRRTVSGFELLQAVLNIVQACSNEHFWVLTLHRPAWSYVESVSGSAKLGFRELIDLSALDSVALETSLLARTRAAGYEPAFEALLQRGRSDKESASEKARSIYWRILSQASLGNPLVALDYWLSSLGQATENNDNGDDVGEAPTPIPVYLFSGHADGEVDAMSDEYLFLLTALVIHDGLKSDDLSEVLNVPLPRVHVVCQHLESLDILTREGPRFQIAPGWQPPVLRVLDRKSFAHR